MNLTNEIAVDDDDLLQAGPYTAAGGHHGLLVGVGEHLHDGVDEGLLGVMRGPVSIPLSHAAHKKVQGIQVWRTRRPNFLKLGQNVLGGWILELVEQPSSSQPTSPSSKRS